MPDFEAGEWISYNVVRINSISFDTLQKLRSLSREQWLGLLDDENTDWAANLILYDIYSHAGLGFYRTTREDWVVSRKEKDKAWWKKTLKTGYYAEDFIDSLGFMKYEFKLEKLRDWSVTQTSYVTALYSVCIKNADIATLMKKYNAVKLYRLLYDALSEEDKDWNANLLLYALTNRDAVLMESIHNREEWVKAGKDIEMKMWLKYYPE